MNVLRVEHADALRGLRVAILGYGNQGRAQALNLRDSGVDVVVGQRPGPSADRAVEDGFEPLRLPEAAQANVLMLTLPDETAADIYRDEIAPHLQPGQILLFTHGFNVHFGLIAPPPEIGVALVAPKGQARAVRQTYLQNSGVPALIAIHHDPDGQTRPAALAYAACCGYARAGLLETTFKEETETDLFGEQAVLCGGMIDLMLAGFRTLVEAGYSPEAAYFECVHEVKIIVDLLLEKGVSAMREGISDTAEWGGYLAGPKVVNASTRASMNDLLSAIQDGSFARQWVEEARAGKPNLRRLRVERAAPDLERAAEALRSLGSR